MQGAGRGRRFGDMVLAAPLPHHEHTCLNGVQWLAAGQLRIPALPPGVCDVFVFSK